MIECGTEDSPALVLFHGVGDDSALMWIYNAPELGRHFHLYAIDTMGGPGKSVPNGNYNKEFDDVRWIDGGGWMSWALKRPFLLVYPWADTWFRFIR